MTSWPDAVPFDPEIGASSPVLEALVRGPAAALSAVLLVVGDNARKSGFGPATAFAIADAWSVGDRTPVLIDLGLEDPSLHDALGVGNDEGVADAFAFGTSLRMLWRTLSGRRFSFLAGGYASDAEELRASGEWRRMIAQESATGHTLLLYVPAHAPGIDALAGKVGAVIVIAEESDLPSAADSLPRPYAVVAVLTPAPNVTEAPAHEFAASEDKSPAWRSPPLIVDDDSEVARAEAGESSLRPAAAQPTPSDTVAPVDASYPTPTLDTDDSGAAAFDGTDSDARVSSDADYERIRVPREGAGREALIADLRARQRAALMAPPADSEPAGGWPATTPAASSTTIDGQDRRGAAAEHGPRVLRGPVPTGSLPGEPPSLEQGATRPGRRIRKVPLPLIILLAVFVLAGAWYYLAWRVVRTQAVLPPQPNTAIPPVDSLAMVPLPFVVAIEAHQQLPTAEERLQALSASEPRQQFFLAPLVRDNVLYYHVFAGPMRDSTQAMTMLDTLLAHRVKTAAMPGDVRQLPLSFVVGSYSSENDASERLKALRKTGIPTFIVMGSVHGQTLWRVYAGAYSGPAESDVMRTLLSAAGIKDSLVTRTGRSNQ